MKAAVLCPGPSVNQTWKSRDGYECVAGVNRAVHRAPCDLWVSLDPTPFEQLPVHWFTSEATARTLKGCGRALTGGAIDEVERHFDTIPHDMGGAAWCTFTSTAALVAMFLRGAKQIDVFGYDATNAPDFDGASLHTNNRNADRWDHEATCWRIVTKWLEEHGCTVTRIRP